MDISAPAPVQLVIPTISSDSLAIVNNQPVFCLRVNTATNTASVFDTVQSVIREDARGAVEAFDHLWNPRNNQLAKYPQFQPHPPEPASGTEYPVVMLTPDRGAHPIPMAKVDTLIKIIFALPSESISS